MKRTKIGFNALPFLLILAFLLGGVVANAQWASGKNHAYLKVGTYTTRGAEKFDDNGGKENVAFTGYLRTSLYARVGIDDRWTVVGSFPRVRVNQNDKVMSAAGDINLTLERNVVNKKFQAAFQLTLGLPTGKSTGGHRTGDGEFNQQLRFVIGDSYKIGPLGFYSKAGASYNNRTKGFADQYKFNAETGTKLFNGRLLVLARYSNLQFVQSQDGGVERSTENFNDLFGANFEIETWSYSASYKFADNWSVSYGKVIPLSGRNVLSASSHSIGLILKF